jgi:hypothetical protein
MASNLSLIFWAPIRYLPLLSNMKTIKLLALLPVPCRAGRLISAASTIGPNPAHQAPARTNLVTE